MPGHDYSEKLNMSLDCTKIQTKLGVMIKIQQY